MSAVNIDKHKYLVIFSYIGTKFNGIQRQSPRIAKEGPSVKDQTVQYYIEQALESINPKPGQDVKFTVSSRTDKGVHAFENSAQLEIVHPNPQESYCPSKIIETANEYFKSHGHEIKLNKIHLTSPEFHFRKHIKWRSYYYRLAVVKPEIASQAAFQPESYLPIRELNRCSLVRTPVNLDYSLMSEAVEYFKGAHDFSNFAAFSRSLNFYKEDHFQRIIDSITFDQVDCSTLEEMDSTYRNINLYEFSIKSKAFLYRQIRRMIGSIVMIGSGQFGPDQFKRLLDEPKKVEWLSHYYMAPAEGLYLSRVKYDPKDFLNPSPVPKAPQVNQLSRPTTGQSDYDQEEDDEDLIEDQIASNQTESDIEKNEFKL